MQPSSRLFAARVLQSVPEFIEAICRHVIKQKQLSVIISDKGATTQSGGSYSGAGVEEMAQVLALVIARLSKLELKNPG